MTNLKEAVLEKIESGKVAMKPYWHHILKTIALISGILLSTILLLYIVTLIVFTLRTNGLWWAPMHNLAGLNLIITNSPWLLITVATVFFVALYILVKHFGQTYRQPAIYIIGVLILTVILATATLHFLSVQKNIHRWSQEKNIPGLSPLYRHEMSPKPEGVTPGIISAISDKTFTLRSHETEYIVQIDERTKLPKNITLNTGMEVVVFGKVDTENKIKALGVRPLPPEMPMDKNHKMGK